MEWLVTRKGRIELNIEGIDSVLSMHAKRVYQAVSGRGEEKEERENMCVLQLLCNAR